MNKFTVADLFDKKINYINFIVSMQVWLDFMKKLTIQKYCILNHNVPLQFISLKMGHKSYTRWWVCTFIYSLEKAQLSSNFIEISEQCHLNWQSGKEMNLCSLYIYTKLGGIFKYSQFLTWLATHIFFCSHLFIRC